MCRAHNLAFEPMQTSFFLSRETVIPSIRVAGMAPWRERLFSAMARNAGSAVEYFERDRDSYLLPLSLWERAKGEE